MISDSQGLVGVSKTDTAECEDIWALWGFLCCIQGSQPSVLSALMLSFLVSVPMLSRRRGGSDEECNFCWLAFPSRLLMSDCHTVAIKKSTKNSGIMSLDKTSQSRHYTKKDMRDIKANRRSWFWWRAVHLDYVMAAENKKIYTTWCWNRCKQRALPCECPFVSFSSQENELRGRHGGIHIQLLVHPTELLFESIFSCSDQAKTQT